jgi:hypothetical protein
MYRKTQSRKMVKDCKRKTHKLKVNKNTPKNKEVSRVQIMLQVMYRKTQSRKNVKGCKRKTHKRKDNKHSHENTEVSRKAYDTKAGQEYQVPDSPI